MTASRRVNELRAPAPESRHRGGSHRREVEARRANRGAAVNHGAKPPKLRPHGRRYAQHLRNSVRNAGEKRMTSGVETAPGSCRSKRAACEILRACVRD